MEEYKKRFVKFLMSANALKFGQFTLKSGRPSPYFINMGDFDDGQSANEVGNAYAGVMKELDIDVIFGPAMKGITLADRAAAALFRNYGINVRSAYNRQVPKDHGEATGKADYQKQWIIGKIKDEDKIAIVDDVFTTGDTKYEALDILNKCAEALQYKAIVIGVDRQETGKDGGLSAVQSFTTQTGIPVVSVVKATEIYDMFRKNPEVNVEGIATHLRQYGTEESKKELEAMLQ